MNNTKRKGFQSLVGLEVHIQLLTASKCFSAEPATIETSANCSTSPLTLGHPGSLPSLNKKVLDFAIKLGLAINAEIADELIFDRKNYFYPDLPKGFQITQKRKPVCWGGSIEYSNQSELASFVEIDSIQIEEDSGRSHHNPESGYSLIDLNRCGIALLELVTKPCLKSGEEAFHFLKSVRRLVRYLEICDGNMEDGSLRCDANISVHKSGETLPGIRTELKNLNSFSQVRDGIEYEIDRHIKLLNSHKPIISETRGWDASTKKSFLMRTKSAGNAYHFMPEPDLNPIKISAHTIEEIKKTLPELPWEKIKRYTKALGLSESEARILAEEPATFRYFEGILESTKNTKAAAHWMLGPILKARNKTGQSFSDLKLKPVNVAELIEVVESGKISLNQAREELFPELLLNPGARVDELVQKLHLFQIEDEDHLILLAKSTLKKYPEKVKLYKQGKRGLMGFFMGELMKQSAGKANPELSRKLLQKCLEANCK